MILMPIAFPLQGVYTVPDDQQPQKDLYPVFITIGEQRQTERDPQHGEEDEPPGAFELDMLAILQHYHQGYQHGHQHRQRDRCIEGDEQGEQRYGYNRLSKTEG